MSITFQYEESLPRLPVPLLESTSFQLLNALKPLLSPEEYETLLDESEKFVDSEFIQLVQEHLVAASSNNLHSCYLNSINDEINPGIYGELRGDVLPRNPYLILEDDPYSKTVNPPNQARRASNLINSTLKFIISLRNETLKPDLTPKNGNHLTMSCYLNLFGTTRIPNFDDKYDHQITIQKSRHINDSRHIIIICHNQYFKLEVLTPYHESNKSESKHQIWFSDHELSVILESIIDSAGNAELTDLINDSIGSLTTQTFTYWKLARLELSQSNKEVLKIIDDALFAVILDSNSPKTDQEKTSILSYGSSELMPGTNIQIGSCTSRWYDKLQLIITKNSVAAVVWELTSMDSTAILRFIGDIYADLILKLAKNINGSEYTLFDKKIKFVSSNGNIQKPSCVKLTFNRTPDLLSLVHLSETRLTDLINQHEFETMNLKLDSDLLENLSVDSFLQVSFQIANYSLYGKIVNTLEPITTRKFRDARTELIAIQNENIQRLAQSFITNSKSKTKWDLFLRCCKDHNKQYHDAMLGKGFDRHFRTLLHVARRPQAVLYLNKLNPELTPIPDLYESNTYGVPLLFNPLLDKLLSPELLVTNCGNNALRLFGIPPAIDQGFGIGYIIHKDTVVITVSSKHRQTKRLLYTFKQVVTSLRSLADENSSLSQKSFEGAEKHVRKQVLNEADSSDTGLNKPLMRHPITLTRNVSHDDSSNDNFFSRDYPSSDNIYDLSGGYGYFDFGEVGNRYEDLSRTDSFLNSQTGSLLGSRRQSLTNIPKYTNGESESKFGLSLSERIRDKLTLSDDESAKMAEYTSAPYLSKTPKNKIGRQIIIQ